MKCLDNGLRIGNVITKNRIFLAPLAGITDMPFRVICNRFGCGLSCTEMISAKGLYYNDEKTEKLLFIDNAEHPVAVQIFGSDPDIMAEIIPKALRTNADIIDINMGCPMPKIVKNGDGSALMQNPSLAGRVISAVVKASPVPVTVKIRSGWDEDSINAPEIAHIAEACGAAAVAVHGRTRKQLYSGHSNSDIITRVKQAVSIPVIGNGDILTPIDAISMFDKTGCDAVMLARGAYGNPWIFQEINELIEFGEIRTTPTAKDKVEMAIRHTKMLIAFKGERVGICESRKHISAYLKGIPGAAKVKQAVNTSLSLPEIEQALFSLL